MTEDVKAWLDKKWDWVNVDSPQFQLALEMITETSENMFICGAGGVGKSILLRMAYDFFGKDRCIVLGSTGISAANIVAEGVPASTIHSALKIPPVSVLDHTMRFSKDGVELITNVDVVLIDEVSMVNASLFDFIMSMANIKGALYRPRVILFGDIFQLPPVRDRDPAVQQFFKDKYGGGWMFFHAKRFSKFGFRTLYLDEVYRQKDPELKARLNALRIGDHTVQDLQYFNTNVISIDDFKEGKDFLLYLASTNKVVDQINDRYTQSFTTEKRRYYATADYGFNLKSHPFLQERVEIAVGQQVMCLYNNREHGYQNGTLGIVEKLAGSYVEIRKEDGTLSKVQFETWKKYEYGYNTDTKTVMYKEVGKCVQIGCKPAFAVTFHKAQGLSLDAVYIDLSSFFIPEAGVYLALSRCRSKAGIGLSRSILYTDIKVDEEAVAFYKQTVDIALNPESMRQGVFSVPTIQPQDVPIFGKDWKDKSVEEMLDESEIPF